MTDIVSHFPKTAPHHESVFPKGESCHTHLTPFSAFRIAQTTIAVNTKNVKLVPNYQTDIAKPPNKIPAWKEPHRKSLGATPAPFSQSGEARYTSE